jgi:aarF domain-containing kinase
MNSEAVTKARLPLSGHWGLFWRRAYILWKGLVVYLSYKSLQWYLRLRRGLSEEAVAALWKRKDEANAQRLYSAVVGLQGLWIKAGQYMSTRGDILPDAFILLFKRLQDSVPSKGLPETLRTIKEELKINELQELFRTFDEAPLATASIAQVHRATLLDGRQVVVKVQHANIHHKILQDLVTLKLVIRLVARFEPDFDFTPIITEWCAEVPKELDFINEAKNMAEVKASIQSHNSNGHFTDKDDLFVDCDLPDTIWEHTTKRVLVMTFVDGHKLSDLKDLTQPEINHVVKHIVRSFAYQIYVSGFFSSDPHPGNFLVSKKDGRWIPVLLDFGLTKVCN